MKIVCIFLLTFSLVSTNRLFAQDSGNDYPINERVTNSLYSSAEFLDNRPNGEFRRLPIDGNAFSVSINDFISQSTDNTAQNGILFIDLRNLNVFENKETQKKTGHIRISLFDHIGDQYYIIDTLDELIEIPKNTSEGLFLSDIIYSYIKNILAEKLISIDSTPYTAEDIRSFEAIEKESFPLYKDTNLTDGLYISYDDFKNQYPLDDAIKVKAKNGRVKDVRATNKKANKTIKIKPEQVYAIVVDGEPFISVENEFVPLYKENNDFWFMDENKHKDNMVYKIDHLNGTPIPFAKR